MMHTEAILRCAAFSQEQWGEAARKMAELVDDDTFHSLEGKSKHQLWLELCDIITKHPKEVSGLKVDAILRSGIRKFTDEVCPMIRARWRAPHSASLTCVWVSILQVIRNGNSKLTLNTSVGRAVMDISGRLLHQARPL